MSAELSRFQNYGFTPAPIESSRTQRIRRVVDELKIRKSLTMSQIRDICSYTHVNSARDLAESIAYGNPDKLCIIPSKENARIKTEPRKLVL